MNLKNKMGPIQLTCGTPNQLSAKSIASVVFFRASVSFHSSQSGHNPGATESTKAPTAFPSFQSLVKLLTGKPVGRRDVTHPSNLKICKN